MDGLRVAGCGLRVTGCGVAGCGELQGAARGGLRVLRAGDSGGLRAGWWVIAQNRP